MHIILLLILVGHASGKITEQSLNRTIFIENVGHLIPQSSSISFLIPIKIHVFENMIDKISWQVNKYLRDFKTLLPIKNYDLDTFDDIFKVNDSHATHEQKVVRFAVRVLIGNALKNSNHNDSKLIISLSEFMRDKFFEAKGELTEALQEVKTKFFKLKSLFKNYHWRRKKGLVNAVGSLGKILFGFATNDDVEDLEKEIKSKKDITERFLKINKKLVQIVDIQNLKLNNISKHFETLNSAVLSLADDFSDLTKSQQLQGYYILEQLLSIISERFTRKIKDLFFNIASSMDQFTNQISLTNLGKLPPSLLGPQELRHLIDATRMQLPAHLRLVQFKNVKDTLLLYKILRTEILQIHDMFFIAIHVPLIDEKNRIEIFKAHSIPVPLSTHSNVTVEIEVPKDNILGIAADRKATITFPEKILENCLKFRDFYFCNLQYPLEKNSNNSKCILQLKTQDSFFKNCNRKIKYLENHKANKIIALGGRTWVYYFPKVQQCKMTCYKFSNGDFVPNFQIVHLKRVGIIKIQSQCQLDCENYYISDSLHVQSKNIWVNKTFPWEHLYLNDSFLETTAWSTVGTDHFPKTKILTKIRKELVDLKENNNLEFPTHEKLTSLLTNIEELENKAHDFWNFTSGFVTNYLDLIFIFIFIIYGILNIFFIISFIKIKKSFKIISQNISDLKLKILKNENKQKKYPTTSSPCILQQSSISLLEGESMI